MTAKADFISSTAARSRVALVLILLAALLAGCAGAASGSASPQTFTDDAGRTVTLKGTPKKIVSLAPSNTEILFALGLGDQVVGVTEYCDYPPAAKEKTKVGGFDTVDTEKVVSLAPDLILATSLHVPKALPALEKLGLTVAVIDPQTVDQVLDRIVLVGKMTGKQKAAEDLRASLQTRIDATATKAKQAGKSPKVFWSLSDGLYTVGPGSFINDMLTKVGATNIASSATSPYPELSMEAVVQADPEVIVATGQPGQAWVDKTKAQQEWQGITAMKSGRVVVIADENIVVRAGPRIADGVEAIARALYPDQFK